MTSNSPIVEAHGVSKRFGKRLAVDALQLQVPAGECFGLLGPNGAGKTTSLRMIYGVTRPTTGTVRVFGIDIAREPRRVRARLGVTLQESVLVEELTPQENLRVFGRYHLLKEPELARRATELLEFLELQSHADMPARYLSGGFKRRLAIALSLMNRPDLLILDEPTTGLDPGVRLNIWSRVRDLRATGTTVLLTTHYMDEAQRLCDRVAIMSEGRVAEEGAPGQLIAAHLAAQTVELDCAPEEAAALLSGFPQTCRRLRAGGRLMVYLDDAAALVEYIHHRDGGDRRAFVVRPTNLEDVFLSVTGTQLEGEP